MRTVVAAAISGDLIDMSQLACSTITLTQGAIEIGVDDLTLQGPGQNALTIDGNNADRVISSYSYGTLSLSDLTIAHGFKGGADVALGGCVYSYVDSPDALLDLTRVTITECSVGDVLASYGLGGGVWSVGPLRVRSSTISHNHATGGAGAAYTGGGIGALNNATIVDSVINGNTAIGVTPGSGYGRGAGLFLAGTKYTEGSIVQGSTISDNKAGFDSGGVYLFTRYLPYSATIVNSTISGNVAPKSAGLAVGYLVAVHLHNSTVAHNVSNAGCGGLYVSEPGNDLQSSIVANNLGADGANHDICGAGTLGGANNLVGDSGRTLPADTISSDPMLGPLQDNGGATFTHALLAGSPAIDVGNNVLNLDFDQRGPAYPRVSGGAADIGAFEVQDSDKIFANGFEGIAL